MFPPTPNFTPSPPTLVPITAGQNDNFAEISARTGVSLLLIEAANPQLVGVAIQPGQKVNIPTGPPPTVAIIAKPNDTLEAIATRNNVSLLLLEAVNLNIVPGKAIPAGTIINVPVPAGSIAPGLRRLQQAPPVPETQSPAGQPTTVLQAAEKVRSFQ